MSDDGQETVEKRGPGRPPQQNANVPKMRGAWPKNRPERMSMDVNGPLTYNPELLAQLRAEGLTPRLVSDDPGRVDKFLRRGYKFVQDDGRIGDERAGEATKLGGNAVKHVGSWKTGFLMAIPTDWYEEDHKRKQDAIDETEKGMKAPRKGAKLAPDAQGEAYGPGLTND
jgi:hypothetical protein